ncbi:MAG: RDD family protein [Pseudomonadota bacterium]
MKNVISHPSLLRRLTAMLYDGLLLVAVVLLTNAAALALLVPLSGGQRDVLPPLAVQILTVAAIVLFYVLFWRKGGQTLGMQAWRIRLVDFDGAPPTVRQGLVRCAAATLSFACLGMGYFWCLFDRHDRYWHDYLSGTELILLPSRKAEKAAEQEKPIDPTDTGSV